MSSWTAGTMVQRNIDDLWFPARILRLASRDSSSERAYDVQYLDDGKTEKDVPLDELRLFSEHDRDGAPPQLPPSSMNLPLSGLLQQGSGSDEGDTIAKTPRAVVHNSSLNDGGDSKHGDENDDSGVFVVEGQQDRLAGGGGLRGIRFLKNSTRA